MPSLLDTYKGTVNPDDFRKSLQAAGIPLANSVPVPSAPASTQAPASTPAAPGIPNASIPTPKFEQGNPYNEILYSKNQYEAPGASDGTKSWAADNAQQFYAMLSPDEAAKVHDMNASQLEAYIPKPPTQQNAAPATPAPSVPSTPYTMTPDQIRAEAQARINKQRTALSQAVGATKTGLKNTFDYNNQITNDRRVLENGAFNRNNSPFTGQTNYLAADLARTRSIQDTAANKDYTAAVSAADQKLADFDANAPEQTDALFNELQRVEREYNLQEGQLTGNFNGQRTLAGQAQDANFTGMYGGTPTMQKQAQDAQFTGMYGGQMTFPASLQLAGLTGTLNGQRTLSGQAQDLNSMQTMAQLTGKLPDGTPTSTEQQRQLQNEWTAAEQTGVISPTLAQLYGIQAGTPTLQAKQIAASIAHQNASLGIEQQNANTSAANAGLAKDRFDYEKDPNNPDNQYKQVQIKRDQAIADKTDKQSNYDSTFTQLKGLYTAKDQDSGAITVTNPGALRAAIIAKNLPDDITIQLLSDFGLPIKQ